MKKELISLFSFMFLFTLVSCTFDIADVKLSKDNTARQDEFLKTEKAWNEINFLDYAQPLIFGVSSSAAGNSVVRGGNNSGFNLGAPGYGLKAPGRIHDDSLEIRSVGGSGGGKVAGSEDGMVFYFKEVSLDKNFKMQADFKVISFTPANDAQGRPVAPNGQEAWGIMARDFIPQYGYGAGGNDKTMDGILKKPEAQNLNNSSSSSYYASNNGGDSNMIMVGGVKRGIRAYWRRGVAYNGVTPLLSDAEYGNGNPTERNATDHANTNFYYWPREWGNYTDLGEENYQERPDFPRYFSSDNPVHSSGDPDRTITYRLTLEKNNNGFFWTIEYPNAGVYPDDHIMKGEPRKGRIRDRTIADRFNSNIQYDPNSRDPRPVIDPIDSGSIPPYEDILKSVNTQNYYVGFFAARDAVVWVNNIKYWEADINDCDPQDPIIPSQLEAVIEILTPEIYTGINYLHVKTNIPGYLAVTQDFKQIPNSVINNMWISSDTGSAVAHNMFVVPILPPKNGENTFTLTFYPGVNLPEEIANSTYEGVVLKSTDAINRTFVITKKVFHNGIGDIYVSDGGYPRNSGTKSSPLDLQTAINHVQPGQDIVMMDGVYMLQDTLVIPRYNDGRSGALKTLRAENKNKAALDWKWKQDPANNRPPFEPMKGRALHLLGNYWKLEGFHVRNAPGDVKGLEVTGSNNILSWLTVYSNGDSGLQIAGNSNEPTRYWPSNNRVEYCESFNNRDTADTNADGFTAKLTVGKDNVFYRCIGHSNVDDGWDFFAKRETGPIGIVTIEECVTYGAGVMSVKQPDDTWKLEYFGNSVGKVSRNGFKMGGEGISVKHLAIESVSFGNDGHAFTSNSNPSIFVRRSTAINTNGTDVGKIYIYAAPVDGKEEDCISDSANQKHNVNIPQNGYAGILFAVSDSEIYERSLDGFDGYQGRFMKRRADGRPFFGNVYASGVAGKGAGRLYLPGDLM